MPRTVATTSISPARPVLKWAGGKRQLLRELRRFVPAAFPAYHEPFLGSGALFFDLWRAGRLRDVPCRLADANPDLIGVYQALASDADRVITELRRLAASHQADGASAYYRIRDGVFNPARRQRDGQEQPYPPALAAMFLYLNRTGYNGLFRLNARGDFNVPVGRYASPRICDEATLRAASSVLGSPLVRLAVESFSRVGDAAGPGDLVYLDPPYAPLTATARFTSYTPASFSAGDQRALQQLAIQLAERGCAVVISNSTAAVVTELYENAEARRAGLRTWRIPARRAINSNASRRGAVEEYIISNVAPRA